MDKHKQIMDVKKFYNAGHSPRKHDSADSETCKFYMSLGKLINSENASSNRPYELEWRGILLRFERPQILK